MHAIPSVFFGSLLAVLAYALYFILTREKKFESAIRKLQKHAQVMLLCWTGGFPVFVFLLGVLSCNCSGISYPSRGELFLVGIAMLLGLFFIYTAVYFLVDRSISSRMMIEIEKSPKKGLTFEELKDVYGIDAKYRDEIEGMVRAGFLIKKDGRYTCSPKARVISAIGAMLKKLLKLGPGG